MSDQLELIEVSGLDELGAGLEAVVDLARGFELSDHLPQSSEVGTDVFGREIAVADAMTELVLGHIARPASDRPVVLAIARIRHAILLRKLRDLGDLSEPIGLAFGRVLVGLRCLVEHRVDSHRAGEDELLLVERLVEGLNELRLIILGGFLDACHTEILHVRLVVVPTGPADDRKLREVVPHNADQAGRGNGLAQIFVGHQHIRSLERVGHRLGQRLRSELLGVGNNQSRHLVASLLEKCLALLDPQSAVVND